MDKNADFFIDYDAKKARAAHMSGIPHLNEFLRSGRITVQENS